MTAQLCRQLQVALPFDLLFSASDRFTDGWSISGTTRFSTGFPVTLYDDSDNSLLGTLGNGINNYLLDTPEYHGGAAGHQHESAQRPARISTPRPSARRPSANWEMSRGGSSMVQASTIST